MNAEDLIERICRNSFFADFTIRSPKYIKACGLEREAADIILFFRKMLFVFQVKSIKYKPGVPEEILLARCSRRIQKAATQFRSLKEAIERQPKTTVRTSCGTSIEIDFLNLKRIYFLIILDLQAPPNSKIPFQSRIANSCIADMPIPLHGFMREQFEVIAEECDTIADFSIYLDFWEVLHRKKCAVETTDPLDALALLRYRREAALAMIGESACEYDYDGLWHKYVKRNPELIYERREKNAPSYIYDKIISRLHTSINYPMRPPESIAKNLLRPIGGFQNYWEIIEYLAALNREERQIAGLMLLRKLKVAATQDMSFGGIVVSRLRLGIVFAASIFDAPTRCELLGGIGIAFLATTEPQVDTVIGISMGRIIDENSGVETILIRSATTDIPPHVRDAARGLFGDSIEKTVDDLEDDCWAALLERS